MSWSIAAAIGLAIATLVTAVALWRKRVGARRLPAVLQTGRPLPHFRALGEDGQVRDSASLKGAPAVILFVRGNWCPFCSRQVVNLTKYYKDINDHGARLVFITPKPLETTRRVAEFYAVDFEYWLDDALAIAKQLGLAMLGGVPKDSRAEYGSDTLWPAALVVDEDGIIRFAAVSKFIADRPDPKKLLQVLQTINRSSA